ncbi:MAG: hypothetical protein UHN88_02175 [Eubacterium sp.]|nr:hypothetical protein [Eubacterium sp.]
MIITDEAKIILAKVLAQQEGSVLTFHTQEKCSGPSLVVTLTPHDEKREETTINDLPVYLDEETVAWTGNVTIRAKGQGLVIDNPDAAGCSGCGGGCCG